MLEPMPEASISSDQFDGKYYIYIYIYIDYRLIGMGEFRLENGPDEIIINKWRSFIQIKC